MTATEIPPAAKTKAESIKITKAEGVGSGRSRTVRTWAEATGVLWYWSHDVPKGGCYDKCDFVVTWADGKTYEGRFDLHHGERLTLQDHVLGFLAVYAGRAMPAHTTKQKYAELLKYDNGALRARCDAILHAYQIGDVDRPIPDPVTGLGHCVVEIASDAIRCLADGYACGTAFRTEQAAVNSLKASGLFATYEIVDIGPRDAPMPGDLVVVAKDWNGVKAGSVGMIDGHLSKPDKVLQVCFAFNAFRGVGNKLNVSDRDFVSCSGGPVPFVRADCVTRLPEPRSARCWRWAEFPEARGGEEYKVTVPAWQLDPAGG